MLKLIGVGCEVVVVVTVFVCVVVDVVEVVGDVVAVVVVVFTGGVVVVVVTPANVMGTKMRRVITTNGSSRFIKVLIHSRMALFNLSEKEKPGPCSYGLGLGSCEPRLL